MDGNVYAIASGKGGVGKTTTTLNLGIALRRRGHDVALVDADLGMANLGEFLGIEDRPTVHDVLSGSMSIDDAMVEHADGFLLLPGDRSLDAYADAHPGGLREIVETLAERYEYVLIDTGPSLSYDDVLPLGLVDWIVPVTTPDPAAVGDTRKTVEIADLLDTPVRGLVINRADESVDAAAVAEDVGVELLGVIPDAEAIAASTTSGEPLWQHHGDSAAVSAYNRIAATLTDEEPPSSEDTTGASGDATATQPADSSGDRATEADGEPSADGAARDEADGHVETETPDRNEENGSKGVIGRLTGLFD